MMDKIRHFIQSLPPVSNVEDSVCVFRKIYNYYNTEEWMDYNILFKISNIIARDRPDLISVGIRLNVQVNLFLRTIQTFHTDRNLVKEIGDSKELGCFALTESTAGVLSGLYVDTVFTEQNNVYNITTNGLQSTKKNWISQGIVSRYMVLFAKNVSNYKDVRIFLLDSDKYSYQIVRTQIHNNNIRITKTLDLAQIEIYNIKVPKSTLLNKTNNIKKNDLLNSIYYGRIMIAEAISFSILGMLDYCDVLIKENPKLKIHEKIVIASQKKINILIDNMLFIRSEIIKNQDINRINAYKIKSVQTALNLYAQLSQLFGVRLMSYPLKYDDLLLNKVAEGDIDVLRLSLIQNELNKGIIRNLLSGHFSYYQLIRLNSKICRDYLNKTYNLIIGNILNTNYLINDLFENKKYYAKEIIESKL